MSGTQKRTFPLPRKIYHPPAAHPCGGGVKRDILGVRRFAAVPEVPPAARNAVKKSWNQKGRDNLKLFAKLILKNKYNYKIIIRKVCDGRGVYGLLLR